MRSFLRLFATVMADGAGASVSFNTLSVRVASIAGRCHEVVAIACCGPNSDSHFSRVHTIFAVIFSRGGVGGRGF